MIAQKDGVAWLGVAKGSWDGVLIVAAVANIVAALLALFVLKPWRRRVMERAIAGLQPAMAHTVPTAESRPAAIHTGGALGAVFTGGAIAAAAAAGESPTSLTPASVPVPAAPASTSHPSSLERPAAPPNYFATSGSLMVLNVIAAALITVLTTVAIPVFVRVLSVLALLLHAAATIALGWVMAPDSEAPARGEQAGRSLRLASLTTDRYRTGWRLTMLALLVSFVATGAFVAATWGGYATTASSVLRQ